ncbi:muts domain V domain-containing protein [Trichoderma ceciliae]
MFQQRTAHSLWSRPLYARRSPASALSPASLRCRYPGAVTILNLTTTPRSKATVKRSRTTVKLSNLPQGKIGADPLPLEEEQHAPAYPTVVLQARRNMDKFERCVLLTRVGGFYELYFEHAEEYAPLLNLKLASKKTNAGLVPMAGFPVFQLDRFLKVLVQDLNQHVAVAEEFPNDASEKIKSGGLMHDRRVTRIITPGTLIDENFIDPYVNNYIMGIHISQDAPADTSSLEIASSNEASSHATSTKSTPLGLAWLDLSTGQFFTQSTTLSSLPSILSRIAPREVILEQTFELQKDHDVFSILTDDRHLVTFSPHESLTNLDDWAPLLESQISEVLRTSFTDHEVTAGGLVLNYVKNRLLGMSMKLQPPLRYENMQTMTVDKNSLRALEIKQTNRDGFFRGSLLHAIRRTVTKSGARLLNEWLGSPSTSLDVIDARQELVAQFIEKRDLSDSMIVLLRRSHDCQRLVQKFALGRGDPDDLLGIANTIRAAEEITNLLQEASNEQHTTPSPDCLAALASRIDLRAPLKLSRRIKESIDEEGIAQQQAVEDSEAEHMMALAQDVTSSEGSQEDIATLIKGKRKKTSSVRELYGEDNEPWIMRPAASKGLQNLHDDLTLLIKEKSILGDALRERLGAQSLTLRWASGVGHIAHVKGKDTKNLAEIATVSSSRTTRSFQIPEWTALGQRLDQAKFRIRREEQKVFQALREQVVKNLVKLRHTAAVLDEIDIATSFAKLAIEQNLARPKLNNSRSHVIIGGRHPTVEGGLLEQGRRFVRNDCVIGPPPNGSLWLITGPNMAGKSTFLRQNALITIMAQIGCYVPASYAELGIVDAIFSRVGSADSLYHDQSTFMVEMLETAQILRQATPQSFVIMDEIGRGTTPEDGTAISFACLHHLVTINQCRTLFATHFHDVADMAAAEGFCQPHTGPVQAYCTDVKEDDSGSFVYVHKLRPGINRRSHALKVARLAGLPQHAIHVAKKVLDATKTKDNDLESNKSHAVA